MKEELKVLLSSSVTGDAMIDGLEISHSQMPEIFYITRVYPGFTGIHEDGTTHFYQYLPMKITRASTSDDLSQKTSVTIQDCNDLIAPNMDFIDINTDEQPTVKLRTFIMRSDGGISDLQDGPYIYQAPTFTMTPSGAAFTAEPPSTNNSGAGENYTSSRFPSLTAYKK